LKILVDTNIIVRLSQPKSDDFSAALDAVAKLPALGN
jgi:hypothetical protein